MLQFIGPLQLTIVNMLINEWDGTHETILQRTPAILPSQQFTHGEREKREDNFRARVYYLLLLDWDWIGNEYWPSHGSHMPCVNINDYEREY